MKHTYLTEFIKYWRKKILDIITGWNVDSFDMTYLCNRVDRLFGEGEHKKFSPWNMSDVREYTNMVQKNQKFTLIWNQLLLHRNCTEETYIC